MKPLFHLPDNHFIVRLLTWLIEWCERKREKLEKNPPYPSVQDLIDSGKYEWRMWQAKDPFVYKINKDDD